ncbi:MAG: phage tail tip lysozyme [Elusimicrobia bacterium]|nr:phage tail tip lysozyme [Elusimicrobiota bacterium]
MSLLDRQKELAGYLVEGGWPLVSAAASVGNATQENLCLPVTKGAKDHGSDGLYQWRLSRLDDLKAWASNKGLDWTLMKTQAAFHQYEVARDYKALDAELRAGVKPIETLTANICFVYERPSAQYANLDGRIRYARDTYAAMQGQARTGGKTAPVVVTSAGAASAAAAWKALVAYGFPPIEVGMGTAIVALLVVCGYLSWLLTKQQRPIVVAGPEGATPLSDPEELLRAALNDYADLEKALAAARQNVVLQKEAVATVAANHLEQAKQAEELIK